MAFRRLQSRQAPAAAPAPAPWPGPRRSASRRRCGRARSRSGGAPAAPAAARRCWPPTAPGRTPGRRDHPASQHGEAERPAASRPRSGRSRRASAMARTDSRSFSEKCRPTPNISRMTPISASSVASAWSATKPGVNGPTGDAGEQIADQRRDPQALAIAPKIKASPRPATMVAIRGVSCGIRNVFAQPDSSRAATK